jgi:uncharacterized membrane protein required for colicin V production
MLDLALGALLVGLGIRGWTRGLIRELISLAVLIFGTIAAFRLSTPLGRVLVNMSRISPDVARYLAGFVIFLAISLGAAIVSRVLHIGIRFLPGASTLDRAAGAALSLLAFTLVVTLAVSLATVLDLPDNVEQQVEQSTVAAALTNPDGIPQQALGLLSGDRVVEISLRIRSLTGHDQAVAAVGAPLEIPATDAERLTRVPSAETAVLALLNRERVAADVEPLPRASGLDDVAFTMARDGYSSGHVEVLDGAPLRAALDHSGIPTTKAVELVVLAAGPEPAHAALVGAMKPGMTAAGYTRVGIAVVKGPFGLLVIELLTD